ncbi:MAG: glycosyltransferase [Burkholderiales bacterium]
MNRRFARAVFGRLPAPVRQRLEHVRGARRPLRWSVRIGAPVGRQGDVWGDTAFAEDLAQALRRRGQEVFVDRWDSRIRPDAGRPDDVTITLRGLHLPPKEEGAVNILWVISHPDMVSDDEIRSGYDLVFGASESWAVARTASSGRTVVPLLQATNPDRFRPGPAADDLRSDVLFVGTTRETFRPAVRDAILAGFPPAIYGHGWEEFVDPALIRANHLDNARLPDAYRSARIVLNDHWDDMKREGFLSNRLFDASAAGARIVSDAVDGLLDTFGPQVQTYSSVADLQRLLRDEVAWPPTDELAAQAAFTAQAHSFDRRAEQLIDAVAPLVRRRMRPVRRAASRG